MTPTTMESQEKARHFANTVFVIGAGVLMVTASLVQPLTQRWLGGATGEHFPFIAATALIAWLAVRRPQLALYSLRRQCAKHGHIAGADGKSCERCLETIAGETTD